MAAATRRRNICDQVLSVSGAGRGGNRTGSGRGKRRQIWVPSYAMSFFLYQKARRALPMAQKKTSRAVVDYFPVP